MLKEFMHGPLLRKFQVEFKEEITKTRLKAASLLLHTVALHRNAAPK
jgi:hypothetical protein